MVEVGIPCAKGMFEVGMFEAGMVGMEGFWGAMGSLGNLARAASISSLLIIAFVAALTCLGAIRILYCNTQSLSLLSFRFGNKLLAFGCSSWCLQVFPQTPH